VSTHFHVIVWMDHHEARIFHFGRDDADRVIVHPKRAHQHLHHKANSVGSGHLPPDRKFMRDVAVAIADAGEILLTGPAGAKLELAKFLKEDFPAVSTKVVAVETLDHPTDGVLLDHARRYFKAADRMLGVAPPHAL
jgi:stalled ribosome rescue protein Dom34